MLVALGLPFLALEYYLEGVARSFGWFRLAAIPVYILRPILIGGACLALNAGGVVLTLPAIGAVLIGAMALVAAGLGLVIAGRMRAMAPPDQPAPSRRQQRLWLATSLPLLLLSMVQSLLLVQLKWSFLLLLRLQGLQSCQQQQQQLLLLPAQRLQCLTFCHHFLVPVIVEVVLGVEALVLTLSPQLLLLLLLLLLSPVVTPWPHLLFQLLLHYLALLPQLD